MSNKDQSENPDYVNPYQDYRTSEARMPRKDPLNRTKRLAEIEGKRMLLLELINAANKVGATSVTIVKLEEYLEDIS